MWDIDTDREVAGLSLRDVLSPLNVEEFRRDVFAQNHCQLSGDRDRFTHLLSEEDLFQHVYSEAYDVRMLKVVRDDEDLPPRSFIEQGPSGRLRVKKPMLQNLLKSGSALIVPHLQRYNKRLWDLCGLLGELVAAEVSVNVYFGDAKSVGFDMHVDHHDVFVFQVSGSKLWAVAKPTCPSPLAVPEHMGPSPQEVIWEGELKQGEVLYFPRGFWHGAKGTDEGATLHLSFGVQPCTGLHIVYWLAKKLMKSQEFRQELPRFEDPKILQEHSGDLSAWLSRVWDKELVMRFLEEHQKRLRAERNAFETKVFKEKKDEIH